MSRAAHHSGRAGSIRVLARRFECCSRFPATRSLMLMKNRDDDRAFLATNEVRSVWKMAQQRTSYTLADFRKLIGKRTDPFDRPSKLLGESSPTSFIVA